MSADPVLALAEFVTGERSLSKLTAAELTDLAADVKRVAALVDWFNDGNRKMGKITDALIALGATSVMSDDLSVKAAVKRPPKKTIDVPSVLHLAARKVWATEGELPAQVGAYLAVLCRMLNDRTWTWSVTAIETEIGARSEWERIEEGAAKLEVKRIA